MENVIKYKYIYISLIIIFLIFIVEFSFSYLSSNFSNNSNLDDLFCINFPIAIKSSFLNLFILSFLSRKSFIVDST